MKNILRVASVVLLFLIWLAWCFSDYLLDTIHRMLSMPDNAWIILAVLLIAIPFAAVVLISVIGLLVRVSSLISMLVLQLLGRTKESNAVDVLFHKDNAVAFFTVVIVLFMLIITCITKTDFVLRFL